ncbi:MAG: HAMP domain-containing protein, partial [Candidatus Nanopelagicales bacterium]
MNRPGILSRILLLATSVASIAVVVAALVSLPLIRSNAQAIAADDLSRLADLTASSLRVDREGRYVVPQRVGDVLLAEGVTAYVVSTGATDLPVGVDGADVAAVTGGESVQRTADTVDGTVLIAGRAYEPGTGVILVQSASVAGSSAGDILVRLVIALLIGLAIAVIIAVVASVRIITPLRRAADAAHRLGGGDRNVHVDPEGPAEIADIAEAL